MIVLEHVTRDYGRIRAVEDVSFRVAAGEIAGFLGPNGAGKSTVLKMISTWLPPTSGRVEVHGHDTVADGLGARRALGYLPEHNALYDGMRVDRFLRFVGRVHGLSGARLRARMDAMILRVGLAGVLEQRIRECSKGYRQRIGLAAALLHDPPVLVLDEPTHGLDPLQVVEFRRFLQSLRQDRAILFSSHILSEVVAISDRLLLIHRGRLLEDAPTRALCEEAEREGRSVEDRVLAAVRAAEPAP